MNNHLPIIIGICLGVPIAAKMELNWLGSGMLCGGICALCQWFGC